MHKRTSIQAATVHFGDSKRSVLNKAKKYTSNSGTTTVVFEKPDKSYFYVVVDGIGKNEDNQAIIRQAFRLYKEDFKLPEDPIEYIKTMPTVVYIVKPNTTVNVSSPVKSSVTAVSRSNITASRLLTDETNKKLAEFKQYLISTYPFIKDLDGMAEPNLGNFRLTVYTRLVDDYGEFPEYQIDEYDMSFIPEMKTYYGAGDAEGEANYRTSDVVKSICEQLYSDAIEKFGIYPAINVNSPIATRMYLPELGTTYPCVRFTKEEKYTGKITIYLYFDVPHGADDTEDIDILIESSTDTDPISIIFSEDNVYEVCQDWLDRYYQPEVPMLELKAEEITDIIDFEHASSVYHDSRNQTYEIQNKPGTDVKFPYPIAVDLLISANEQIVYDGISIMCAVSQDGKVSYVEDSLTDYDYDFIENLKNAYAYAINFSDEDFRSDMSSGRGFDASMQKDM